MKLVIPETRYKEVVLPGGWETEAPDIKVDRTSPRYVQLVRTFMRLGASPGQAHDEAEREIQRLFGAVWGERVRKAVSRWAYKYTLQNHGSLRGFDPARVAMEYVPGQRFVLRAGDPNMRRLFGEMMK